MLKPASYREMDTTCCSKNGFGTNYGLGVDVNSQGGHGALSHGGEVSGFTAQNTIFPDDRAAVVVLTNQDAAGAAGDIAGGDRTFAFLRRTIRRRRPNSSRRKRSSRVCSTAKIDRSLFTDNANAYFSEHALKDFAAGLGPLGTPQSFIQVRQGLRGGMTLRVYIVGFRHKTFRAWTYEMPDGKLEQYQIAAQN